LKERLLAAARLELTTLWTDDGASQKIALAVAYFLMSRGGFYFVDPDPASSRGRVLTLMKRGAFVEGYD
jgi:hypothetical protein